MTIEFTLPAEREAREPPESRGQPRDSVRMLVSRRRTGTISHHAFTDLARVLLPGDLVVVNTSATLPAAVRASEDLSVHFSTPLPDGAWMIELRAASGPATAPYQGGTAGMVIELPGSARLTLCDRVTGRLWRARLSTAVIPYLLRHGTPIRYSYVPKDWPAEAYQTVFAARPGSEHGLIGLGWPVLRHIRVADRRAMTKQVGDNRRGQPRPPQSPGNPVAERQPGAPGKFDHPTSGPALVGGGGGTRGSTQFDHPRPVGQRRGKMHAEILAGPDRGWQRRGRIDHDQVPGQQNPRQIGERVMADRPRPPPADEHPHTVARLSARFGRLSSFAFGRESELNRHNGPQSSSLTAAAAWRARKVPRVPRSKLHRVVNLEAAEGGHCGVGGRVASAVAWSRRSRGVGRVASAAAWRAPGKIGPGTWHRPFGKRHRVVHLEGSGVVSHAGVAVACGRHEAAAVQEKTWVSLTWNRSAALYLPLGSRSLTSRTKAGTTVAGSGRSEMSSPGKARWCMAVRRSPGSTHQVRTVFSSAASTFDACSSAAFAAP